MLKFKEYDTVYVTRHNEASLVKFHWLCVCIKLGLSLESVLNYCIIMHLFQVKNFF
jgi:hypothetical protein